MDSHRLRDTVQGQMSLVRLVELCPDVPVSLVGGVVRDALLGRPPGPDIDLVVEGDAIRVARRLGGALGVEVTTHARFGTAALTLDDGTLIDLVTARRERYAAPGALPEVTAGTIQDDLARRDFTVNALAYRLTGPQAGRLLDPHGGAADLEAGLIRALRDDAFEEDPSRVLRAARYAARLGFTVQHATAAQARAAAHGVDPAIARVGEELRRLLCEDDAAGALAVAVDLGVAWIVPDPERGALFAAVDDALRLPGAPPLPAWAVRLGLAVSADALGTVAVPEWARRIATDVRDAGPLADRVADAPVPSRRDAVLGPSRPAAQVVAVARGSGAIGDWWANIRDMRPAISGDDLRDMGMAPGPRLGRALDALRAAIVDAEVGPGRDDQLAWVRRWDA